MSNIAFITTQKYVRSYDILGILESINNKRFGGKLTITGSGGNWVVGYQDDWDGLDFYADSARKIHVKHPHGMWWEYVGVVFRHELGKVTKAILSDESTEETWKPSPKKYLSYETWIRKLHSSWKDKNPASYEETIQIELSYASKGMEKY